MMIVAEPFYTTCSMCETSMVAMPGPRNKTDRPTPPAGFRVGYIVELAERSYAICRECLDSVLH